MSFMDSLNDLSKSIVDFNSSLQTIPAGTQLFSKRPEIFSPERWPTYYVKAKGITIWDKYGNKYLDMSQMGVGSCIFVQDFLAVRAIAVLALLLGKVMVDTGRPHLGESPFVLVIQVWAYVFVAAGIWFTITPWRLRDLLELATANATRVRIGSAIRLAFAVFILTLGLTVFRPM